MNEGEIIMAEFCRECFIDKLLTASERADYESGKLKIVMFETPDFCEGCQEIIPIVNYVIRED